MAIEKDTTNSAGTYAERVEAAKTFSERVADWHATHDALDVAYAEAHQMVKALGDGPVAPEILRQPLTAVDGTERLPPESPVRGDVPIWTSSALAAIIDKAGMVVTVTVKEENRMSVTTERRPLSSGELSKAIDMWNAAREFEVAAKAHKDKRIAIEDTPHHRYGHVWPDGMSLVAEPLSSLLDVPEKLKIIKRLGMIGSGFSSEADDALVAMLDNISELIAAQA